MQLENSWLGRCLGGGLLAAVASWSCLASAAEEATRQTEEQTAKQTAQQTTQVQGAQKAQDQAAQQAQEQTADEQTTDEDNQDPWEGFNRAMFSFNETMDTYAFKPIARGYEWITPQPVENGIHNFFQNLGEIGNLVNDLLQGKISHAGVDTSRFFFNSTFGLLGLIDVATPMGLQRNDEDFGQTLGSWGVGTGPYLVLPFFGPSNVRDGISKVPDYYTSAYPYIHDDPYRYGLEGLDLIDTRAHLLSSEKMITGDKYIFIRNAYMQNREFKVKDGQVVDDF